MTLKHPVLSTITVAVSLALTPAAGFGAVIGFLGNFDVINDTGSEAHGFEIELEGLHSSDITDTFGGPGRGFPTGRGFDPATSVQRYGSPIISEYTNGATFGTKVTYLGLFDSASQSWDYGTPSGTFITPGDNCWSGGGVGYSAATPCDHFGVGTTKNATKTTYSWLIETATPGVLTNGLVNLPAPVWDVIPAPPPPAGQPPAPPVVGVAIQAPEPVQIPGLDPQFGDAIWVKVYTTELEDAPELEDLVADNAVIQQAKTEIEWQLLQMDPGNPDSGKLESGYGIPVGPDAASILRRYEFFEFSGYYDPEDHEAKFDPGFGDSNPGPNDVGTYLGAQNGAANFNIAAIPEPQTYAMLIGGLALVVATTRRHRQRRR